MPSLPKRPSLVQATVETLKEWIETRMLQGILPGELPLKHRLGVGRDTVRLALQTLTREGWVSAPSRGKQRRVLHPPKGSGAPAAPLPVTFLSPYSPVHRLTLMELEDLQLHLGEQNRPLRFVSPDVFHLRRPARQLERLVHENPSAAWILYVVGEQIQRWFSERGIPALILGSAFPGVKLPFVVDDWEASAFHAGIQLVRHGHRRVGILEYWERFPGLIAEERGLKRALTSARPSGSLLVFKDDRAPASVAQSLHRAFSLPARPTALVLSSAPQVLTTLSWLASRGLRVPADVSLVSLADDSWFSDFYPPLTYYQSQPALMGRQITNRVLELVSVGQVRSESRRIARKYMAGATIGPAPLKE